MPRSEGIETYHGSPPIGSSPCPERMPRSEGIETYTAQCLYNCSFFPGTNAPIRGD